MTAAVEFLNTAPAITPPAQLTTRDEQYGHQDSAFAVLLAALARPSVTATEHDRLDLRPVIHSASEMAAPRREALHELRAAEFQETSVFGLMRVIAFAGRAEHSATLTQRVGPSFDTSGPRPPQRTYAPDVAICRAVPGIASHSETATQGTSPRQPLVAQLARGVRPQHVAADDAPVTLRVQGQTKSRSQARISFHCADHRPISLASGQTSAVHVAITAAEHGLSVFARVGRMEPTERARLRHAAALLLAEYGHHGATVTLDAGSAEAKGE